MPFKIILTLTLAFIRDLNYPIYFFPSFWNMPAIIEEYPDCSFFFAAPINLLLFKLINQFLLAHYFLNAIKQGFLVFLDLYHILISTIHDGFDCFFWQ